MLGLPKRSGVVDDTEFDEVDWAKPCGPVIPLGGDLILIRDTLRPPWLAYRPFIACPFTTLSVLQSCVYACTPASEPLSLPWVLYFLWLPCVFSFYSSCLEFSSHYCLPNEHIL